MTDLSPELELLIRAASIPATAAADPLHFQATELDWSSLLKLARAHGMLTLLASRLGDGAFAQVPPEPREALQGHVRRLAARNLWMSGELASILARLDDHGVQAVAYKGPTLAMLAYENLAAREFLDLDLLIRAEHLPATRQLFASWGFREESSHLPLVSSGSQYALSFQRPQPALQVEVHWNFVPRFFAGAYDPADFIDRARTIELAGRPVRTLDSGELLFVLCLHGAKHMWHRLAWISDVAHLIVAQPDLDWRRLLEFSRQAKLQRAVRLGLWLANRLLSAPLPDAIAFELLRDRKLPHLASQVCQRFALAPAGPAQGIERGLFQLRTRDSIWQQTRFCFQLATTPNDRDRAWLPLPDRIAAGYYFSRPLRLLSQFGKRLWKT